MRANDEDTSFVGNVRFFALLNASEKCIYILLIGFGCRSSGWLWGFYDGFACE